LKQKFLNFDDQYHQDQDVSQVIIISIYPNNSYEHDRV